jgi:NitT/TauT family transport system permease protein
MAEKEPVVASGPGSVSASAPPAATKAASVATKGSETVGAKLDVKPRSESFNRILGLLSPLLVLALWELGVLAGMIDDRFFPPPSQIASTFWDMLMSGELLTNVGVSLLRIIGGFMLGAIPGLLVGLAMGIFKPVRMLLRPIISATYPIPKLALMPLIVLIFGFGEEQKVITIALGVFYIVLINTLAGVLNLDKIYMDVAKNFGASRRDYYFRVALPGALPLIFAGIELGMGMALLLIVAAEMQGTLVGIGQMIWEAQALFAVKKMFVAFILISALGYIFAESILALQRKVVPWKT